jgi:uncharacterized protein YndB with AHSA1/START domain
MEKMQFSIEIQANKEKVWKTLRDDKTFRDWSSIIDEGTYMKGVMKEGNEVEFMSSVGGYGVTSLVEKLDANEFVLFRHSADTQKNGKKNREKERTGGMESYTLTQKNNTTLLTIEMDIPPGQEETFQTRVPKALARIKVLSEM